MSIFDESMGDILQRFSDTGCGPQKALDLALLYCLKNCMGEINKSLQDIYLALTVKAVFDDAPPIPPIKSE